MLNLLVGLYDERKDHSHPAENQSTDMHIEEAGEIDEYECTTHHQVAMVCQRALVRHGVRHPNGYDRTVDLTVSYIFPLAEAAESMDAEEYGTCDRAKSAITTFVTLVGCLKTVVKGGWSGVCFQCLKDGKDDESCGHPKPVADLP